MPRKPQAVALLVSVPILVVGAVAIGFFAGQSQTTMSPSRGAIHVENQSFVPGTGETEAAVLAYGHDSLQDMEVYYRKDQQKSPIVFIVHGGGADEEGDRTHMRKIAPLFTEPGFTVVMPNYRYGDSGTFLSSYDVACSIATFAKHASEYGADPNRIIVMGFSHGGWVSSFTVYDQERDWLSECAEKEWPGVDGFIGSSTNYGMPRYETLWNLLGISDMSDLEGHYADISGIRDGAINYLDSSDVPAFLVHGTADPKFNELRPQDFAKAMEAAGASAEVHIVEGGVHTTSLLKDRTVLPALIKFVQNIFELK